MKVILLIKHLRKHDCVLLRHAKSHDCYVNTRTERVSFVPRHREVKWNTVKYICDQLGIPRPTAGK